MNCTATTRLTAEECLARLDALRPMPRGLRLEAYAEDNHGVTWCQNRNPLWLDLFDGDGIPISVSQKGEATWPDPKVIRRWAAPVRRLREERRALRARVRELEDTCRHGVRLLGPWPACRACGEEAHSSNAAKRGDP